MNLNKPPYFRQGKRYQFTGFVLKLFGYQRYVFNDYFSFGIRDSNGNDHVLLIIDNHHRLDSTFELNQVVEVTGICLYGHFFAVSENYSPYDFRAYNLNAVVPTNMYFVPATATYKQRIVQPEMDAD
ncbi:hypothetical protein KQX54_015718 [Cotesia glomerata]|uniref:Uncharacterized protein n=1 Tax=Cotesia glomerata TaxID=32391 RepID=A0AAV7J845_COTGL|nr:hypothetical protein KQX54_015718 [Cotesia glomerata]